ncbi:MAG: N-6 DNA methylase [Candidatus Lokiarchaeota archaeon]|nr:N-6 DNA methylase [Candidatus Lokiarchaeota archaeon]
MIIEKEIDSDTITYLFGLNSNIFKIFKNNFLQKKLLKEDEYELKYKEWESIFIKIYDQECNYDLFLKQIYYINLVKVFLISKIICNESNDIDFAYENYLSKSNKPLSLIDEFNIYDWFILSKKIFKEIYNLITKKEQINGDLFHILYQHMFFLSARHRIGEFYTPSELVKKMVEDSYVFGEKILDPSCGSGNFIIEIFLNIINSNENEQQKIDAIKKIYGFDINPLAILTVKSNILLLFNAGYAGTSFEIINENIFLIDSLIDDHNLTVNKKISQHYNSFDLIIGNPPWLTYKDLNDKIYQDKIRHLAKILDIKPGSQYITHIELAAIFFYQIPKRFLKINGIIFFVMTQSVLNGDHCQKFRAFSIFDNLEIWDFPRRYFFNVNHICLKARYIADQNPTIGDKYPIKTKILDEKLVILNETFYSSLKINKHGALLILPKKELRFLKDINYSEYKDKFLQGATLVPRTLVFFDIMDSLDNRLIISSDKDILSRSKKEWIFKFKNKEIEKDFRYITFLNLDLVPFLIKKKRNVFIPITRDTYEFNEKHMDKFPYAKKFYRDINVIYQTKKKKTSKINTLFSNLNYWNKLKKQVAPHLYTVVYNASGSNIKSAVIKQYEERIIIGSENYYYSTDSKYEAYYLSAILNSQLLNRYINVIKSSRHIHKRPFHFPIPLYDESNKWHYKLAKKGIKYTTYVSDLFLNNPTITTKKIRTILNENFSKLDNLTKKIVFK